MCMCLTCAEALPSQNNKCPMCRRPALLLLRLKSWGDESSNETQTNTNNIKVNNIINNSGNNTNINITNNSNININENDNENEKLLQNNESRQLISEVDKSL
mmetsp:Transcript_6509/g.6804  ORF Transcript_6509/g.6804 Transcript_6509/m.6804 type:complete len:102 (-) Transcript_6509:25-330(-)